MREIKHYLTKAILIHRQPPPAVPERPDHCSLPVPHPRLEQHQETDWGVPVYYADVLFQYQLDRDSRKRHEQRAW